MANILVIQAQPATLILVGQYWASRFIKCDKDLQLKYNCKYNYQRAKYKNPMLI